MPDCISSHTGKPRSRYETQEAAQEAADYLRARKRGAFYPYKCQKCGFYHLAMERDRIEFSEDRCGCVDSNGRPKKLYKTKADAQKAGDRIRKERGVRLEVYYCPEEKGWHLTHTLF